MRQARNLYLREDVIVGGIFAQLHTLASRGAGLQERIVRLQRGRIAIDLAWFLRAHRITTECRPASISLEPDPERSITFISPADAPKQQRGIPRQRRQQQKQQRGIVND